MASRDSWSEKTLKKATTNWGIFIAACTIFASGFVVGNFITRREYKLDLYNVKIEYYNSLIKKDEKIRERDGMILDLKGEINLLKVKIEKYENEKK